MDSGIIITDCSLNSRHLFLNSSPYLQPATKETQSFTGVSAVIPTIQFPDWCTTMIFPEGQSAVLQGLLDVQHSLAIEAAPSNAGSALPTYTHSEEPLSAVPDSQAPSSESGSVEGEAKIDSESIDRDLEWEFGKSYQL
jgi:hypothetical protein